MTVVERRIEQAPVPADPAWTWDRNLPIDPAPAPASRTTGRGLRVFPAGTWWIALVITLMFAALIVAV